MAHKNKKILTSRFFLFLAKYIILKLFILGNYSSQNREIAPRMYKEILEPKLVVFLSGRSANQMVRGSPILTVVDI